MSVRQDHVRVVQAGGRDEYDLTVVFPARFEAAGKATAAQLDAIDRFYRIDSRHVALDAQQVGVMLDARDYAKAAADSLLPQISFRELQSWQVIVATFIIARPTLAEQVADYMRDLFDRSGNPDDLTASIERSRPFAEVTRFVRDAFADTEEQRAFGK